jgi:hypothetical protein
MWRSGSRQRTGRVARGRCHGPTGSRFRAVPQKLPPGAGQQIAAYVVDVDGKLADSLGGVQKVQGAGVACDTPDRSGGVNQAAAGRHPGQPDQLGPLVDQLGKCAEVDLPIAIVRHDHDLGT